MELVASLEKDAVDVRSAFELFFRDNFPKVARTAALVAGDIGSGQDLAQEAFLHLYRSWDAMQSDEHARNFVFKAAISRARSRLRRTRRLVPLGIEHTEGIAAESGRPDDWPDALAALAKLPYRQRACVVLVDLVDMDSTAVGRMLGISPNTVRVHVMRGRESLRRMLGVSPVEVADER
ncbi:MAG: RNA polymerase sigma factor [Actinomycetota bacterium]